MAWTRDTPPSATWNKEASAPSSWPPTPQINANWGVRRSGSTRRIIEGSSRRRRITEQGVLRVIERFEVHWTIPINPPDPWLKSFGP